MRWGLCCIFRDVPIKFRTTTAAACNRMARDEAYAKIAALCRANAESLREALEYCAAERIGSFRVSSQILPLKTHPDWRYDLQELPGGGVTIDLFRRSGEFAARAGIRTLFHPDQFVVLNSPRPHVVESSIAELVYQAEVSDWIGGDVLNVHLGGTYGDKPAALVRFRQVYETLPEKVRSRLTVENDDKSYTPRDLLPFCREVGIPLVYDVHHHRCLPDGMSVSEATAAALETWNREPVFHISSPVDGWDGPHPERHHDYINPADFPPEWRGLDVTVEVEAKAKERAIAKLRRELGE